jgi:hypothetical protein
MRLARLVRLAVLIGSLVFATAAAASVYFEGAIGPPQAHLVRPRTVYLSADGTLEVEHVHWTRWGGHVAKGIGLAYYHGCSPSCAQAPGHRRWVTVELSNVRICSGQAYYNKVKLYVGRQNHLRFFRSPSYNHWSPC